VIPIKVLAALAHSSSARRSQPRKWAGFTLATAGIIMLALAGVAGDDSPSVPRR
jgi:drug/metabolite transporter (DMT)-like permease